MEADGRPTKELHWSFVAMLFALAIGEVAVGLSNLVNLNIQGSYPLPGWSPGLLSSVACGNRHCRELGRLAKLRV